MKRPVFPLPGCLTVTEVRIRTILYHFFKIYLK
jgi:hypothetical protein